MPPELSTEGQMGVPWAQEEHHAWGHRPMVILTQTERTSFLTCEECLQEVWQTGELATEAHWQHGVGLRICVEKLGLHPGRTGGPLSPIPVF